MAGRPRSPAAAALPRSPIPDPPADYTPAEKEAWAQARSEVDLLGTYTAAAYTEFCRMVQLDAAEAEMMRRGLIENLDAASTRIIGLACTKRAFFGRNPASSRKVAGSPQSPGEDADSEFTEPARLRAIKS